MKIRTFLEDDQTLYFNNCFKISYIAYCSLHQPVSFLNMSMLYASLQIQIRAFLVACFLNMYSYVEIIGKT